MKISMPLIANLTGAVARRARKFLILAVVTLLVFCPLLDMADAAAGDLDLTFGIQGEVVTEFFGDFEIVNGLALQQDGKIVAIGTASMPDGNSVFALARYNSNGSLDPTFGFNGKVSTNFPGGFSGGQDIVILPDGKILTAGGANSDFALVRYNSDGSLDPTFGSDGRVRTSFSNGGTAISLGVQPDGKIVIAGTISDANQEKFGTARYNSDGSLDLTFGSGGKVITDFINEIDRADELVITADGKTVVAGATLSPNGRGDFALVRYNGDGSPDPTFGSGGKVITDFFGGFDSCSSLSLQPDGKLVAGGSASSNLFGSTLAIARYNSDGSLDPTFGVGGKSQEIVPVSARASLILPDGKIIAVGLGFDPLTGFGFDFSVVRYNSDGTLDTTFGSGGRASTDFSGDTAEAHAVVLQPDGKVVLGGLVIIAQNFNFGLARFNGEGPSFDTCIRDDSNGNILQFNSATGDYQFSNCSGLTIGGTGSVIRIGSTTTLQHNAPDHRVLARVDTSVRKATATVQLLSQRATFTMISRDISNNTCACR